MYIFIGLSQGHQGQVSSASQSYVLQQKHKLQVHCSDIYHGIQVIFSSLKTAYLRIKFPSKGELVFE